MNSELIREMVGRLRDPYNSEDEFELCKAAADMIARLAGIEGEATPEAATPSPPASGSA